jgi:cytochrome c oxidase cbb3-type subunit 3/ubiquinol-cytochrome c reductase cytochrome c subunit
MKMMRISFLSALAVLGLVMLAACSTPDGQPQTNSEPVAPSQVSDFDTLYAQNCAGCHGAEGRGGASIALANPVYLAIVDETTMRNIVANGVHGTSMPAFVQSAGGMLTEQQTEVITSGIFSRWGRKHVLDGADPPSYAAKAAGNVDHGQLVFGAYCASCHGSEGAGTPKGSAIANDSFLALVSDQGLRTIVITGRPELGAPDWRGNVAGHPMTDQEITDVVSWLVSRRAENPGQPYSALNDAQQSKAQHPQK